MKGEDCGSGSSSLIQRIRSWWRRAPLAVTFSAYLVAYLTTATMLTAWLLNVVFAAENEEQFVIAFTDDEGLQAVRGLYSGPYIYDAEANELVSASEFPITGSDALGVFVGKMSWAPEVMVNHRGERPVYAKLDDVASGSISLYDWGLNFPSMHMREDVLDYGGAIAANDLAAYDKRMRAVRVDVREELSGVLSSDLIVSNVAYYASTVPSQPALLHAIYVVEGVLPFVIYGFWGWMVFRRFYRVHFARPLEDLARVANRIAAQDLDFMVPQVRGRELGRFAGVMEDMRSALLDANRELWRAVEGRRRLNAAFAHDLRTPLTVLKGSVEMAKMRAARGEAPSAAQMDALTEQVARLERYAGAMSGLSKLEDRALNLETRAAADLLADLSRYGQGVSSSHAPQLGFEASLSSAEGVLLQADALLVEEVLGNLLKNACGHARTRVWMELTVRPIERDVKVFELRVCVHDDGPGFSEEALARGCEPFYSERKSIDHFGLGLNIARALTRLHGGTLELKNVQDGGGACVTATFRCPQLE